MSASVLRVQPKTMQTCDTYL